MVRRERVRAPGNDGASTATAVTTAAAAGCRSVCHILAEDPALADAVPQAHREQAVQECIAEVLDVATGVWRDQVTSVIYDGIGLLVLRGLLIRRVGIDGRFGAEILGDGDVLRPWRGESEPPALAVTAGWQVLEPVRLAVLDMRAARRLARYPELTGVLVGRALERSRNLAMHMAIVHQPRVDVRLHMLLWQLAGRWGRVRGDGISLPLRLTHTILADLVAASRPTVTSALSDLAALGLVRTVDATWLLSGEPPGELLELRRVALAQP
jgi:CRP/FNR family cyclic AMP-dependent transcriptional regulator